MLILYSRNPGSSQEIILGPTVLEPVSFATLKMQVKAHLQIYGNPQSVQLLDFAVFTLRECTNSFGDLGEQMLHASVPIPTYMQLEEQRMQWPGWRIVAKAFQLHNQSLRFIAVSAVAAGELSEVPSPKLVVTSALVDEALRQAETLIASHGATSGFDRVHTAFHGYLEEQCHSVSITFEADSPITSLFALLRAKHPALGSQVSSDTVKVLRSLATIIEVLNTARNDGSYAHPNKDLLKESEAMLLINSVRTMLHYLDAELG